MKQEESFDVLISMHLGDDPSLVQEAIGSIEAQTFQPREILIVFDGPVADSVRRVVQHSASKLPIRVIEFPTNRGLGAALRDGLMESYASIVARMDVDDICEPDRFKVQMEELVTHNLDIVGSFATEIDEQGNELRLRTVPVREKDIYRRVWSCPFIHPSVMFRKSRIECVGSYDPALRTRQDYDLWFRCVAAGLRMKNIPQPLLKYRVGSKVKNRSLSIVLAQVRIGLRNCRRLHLPLIQHILVVTPLLLWFLPATLSIKVRHAFWRITDPV